MKLTVYSCKTSCQDDVTCLLKFSFRSLNLQRNVVILRTENSWFKFRLGLLVAGRQPLLVAGHQLLNLPSVLDKAKEFLALVTRSLMGHDVHVATCFLSYDFLLLPTSFSPSIFPFICQYFLPLLPN